MAFFGMCVWTVACVSTSSPVVGGDAGADASEGPRTDASGADASQGIARCGLHVYVDDGTCQAALDDACCDQEQACAANADCKVLVACINACPMPRTDTCINTCTGDAGPPPGYDALDAIGTCTKTPAFKGGPACDWPQ